LRSARWLSGSLFCASDDYRSDPIYLRGTIYPRVSSAFGAGETALCTALAAASGAALTPASISKPAKVINAAAASVTAVSTIDPDMNLGLMIFSSGRAWATRRF